jgi:hypothetical protein
MATYLVGIPWELSVIIAVNAHLSKIPSVGPRCDTIDGNAILRKIMAG